MQVTIEKEDPVYSRVRDLKIISILRPILSCTAVYYVQGQYKRHRKEYQKVFINKNGYFLTGFLPKIKKFLRSEGHNVTINKHYTWDIETQDPKVKDVVFHDWQLKMIRKAVKSRGVLQAPTGTGKTTVAAGIISCFPKSKILFLCHTLSLMNQAASDFKNAGLKNIVKISASNKDMSGRIVVSTIQTFHKFDVKEVGKQFDVVIVDEAHHVSSLTGMYGKVLQDLFCPVKIGLTATLPDSEEARLTMEGLLGPIVGNLTINNALVQGFLAEPKIRLIKIPVIHKVKDMKRYVDVYEHGIVLNTERNTRIAEIVKEYSDKGNSCLIMVQQIKHGENIQAILKVKGINAPLVQGILESDQREDVKEKLKRKEILAVITTAVWREGVNIPSLDVIINAAGGKSEIMTLQAIGRGLRKTETKNQVIIVDFFDLSHHYLISHSGERVCLYMDNGWL